MSTPIQPQFGKIRSFLFPIHAHELKKLIPMLLMIFFICFNYHMLRCMKESIVLTASGAQTLPFIKVWVMLPIALGTTYLFTRLMTKYSQEKVFYLITIGFLVGFALFGFVIYPMSEHLHPHAFCDFLALKLPQGLEGLINMCRYWTFTGFYALSELWGIMMLSVLFWGFANEITKVHEAKRFYGVLGIGSNAAAMFAGFAGNCISRGSDEWHQTFALLILFIIGTGLMIMAIFRWMNKNLLAGEEYAQIHQNLKPHKTKKKLSLRESFAYLAKSKYLICIAVLVLSYNLVINMVEIVWKDQLGKAYPSPEELNIYMNKLTIVIGFVSMFAALITSKVIGRLGWTGTALVTPVLMLLTSIGFFTFSIFQESLGPIVFALTGTTPIIVGIFFGATQSCVSKICKYSVFDTTKEMSFIPLDHESRLKGKAAIDGVGSRLGKSGGSIIHQGLLLVSGSLTASAPYVALILTGAIAAWMYAVSSLGKQFGALTAEKQNPAAPLPDAEEAGSELQAAS